MFSVKKPQSSSGQPVETKELATPRKRKASSKLKEEKASKKSKTKDPRKPHDTLRQEKKLKHIQISNRQGLQEKIHGAFTIDETIQNTEETRKKALEIINKCCHNNKFIDTLMTLFYGPHRNRGSIYNKEYLDRTSFLYAIVLQKKWGILKFLVETIFNEAKKIGLKVEKSEQKEKKESKERGSETSENEEKEAKKPIENTWSQDYIYTRLTKRVISSALPGQSLQDFLALGFRLVDIRPPNKNLSEAAKSAQGNVREFATNVYQQCAYFIFHAQEMDLLNKIKILKTHAKMIDPELDAFNLLDITLRSFSALRKNCEEDSRTKNFMQELLDGDIDTIRYILRFIEFLTQHLEPAQIAKLPDPHYSQHVTNLLFTPVDELRAEDLYLFATANSFIKYEQLSKKLGENYLSKDGANPLLALIKMAEETRSCLTEESIKIFDYIQEKQPNLIKQLSPLDFNKLKKITDFAKKLAPRSESKSDSADRNRFFKPSSQESPAKPATSSELGLLATTVLTH